MCRKFDLSFVNTGAGYVAFLPVSDYKDRLISLELLPLMMFYKLLDIMFFVKSLKTPNDCFDISNYL